MIQRIQSIYLLLASIAQGTLFIKTVSFADFKEPDTQISASNDGFLNIWDNQMQLIITAIAIAISILAIFLFKNRKNQMRIVGVSISLMGILMALVLWEYQKIVQANAKVSISFVGFIPIFLSIIFAILANRNIKKDELLVRSADRLR